MSFKGFPEGEGGGGAEILEQSPIRGQFLVLLKEGFPNRTFSNMFSSRSDVHD